MARNEYSGGHPRLWVRITLLHRGYSQNGLGPNKLSPGTWRFGSANKELLANWLGGRTNSFPKILQGILFLFLLVYDFSDHFFFFLVIPYSFYFSLFLVFL